MLPSGPPTRLEPPPELIGCDSASGADDDARRRNWSNSLFVGHVIGHRSTVPAITLVGVPDPTVVLVHGFATSSDRTWRDNGWIDLLGDSGRDVLAPDLLGHGRAPKPLDPAAYDAMEQLLFDSFPPEPVDAVGFSLGARALLILAGTHPGRFHRLVLAGVGANLFRGDDPEVVARALEDSAGDTVPADDPVARYFQQLASAPDADPLALAALLRRPDPPVLTDEMLAAITCPVLVVLGDRDFAGPADPLVERLPNAGLMMLRGVDHFATPKSFGFIDAALAHLGADL